MSQAFAQGYPVRPVRIIVPTSPPGGADVVARLMAPGLTERLGQQVVVENRAGASTMIGGDAVAKAPADGYTLLMGISTLAINPATFRKVPYDALRDFVPIMQAVKQTLMLVVHPSFPARSVRELVAIAKARPGDVVYSSPGFGTNPQMGMELFLYMTGTQHAARAVRGRGRIHHRGQLGPRCHFRCVHARCITPGPCGAAARAGSRERYARGGRARYSDDCGGRCSRLGIDTMVRPARSDGHAERHYCSL